MPLNYDVLDVGNHGRAAKSGEPKPDKTDEKH
jgi:hypothetical protein